MHPLTWLMLGQQVKVPPGFVKTEPAVGTPGYLLGTREDGKQYLIPDPAAGGKAYPTQETPAPAAAAPGASVGELRRSDEASYGQAPAPTARKLSPGAQQRLDDYKILRDEFGASTDPQKGFESSNQRRLSSGAQVTTKQLMQNPDYLAGLNMVLGEIQPGEDGSPGYSNVMFPGLKAEKKRLNELAGHLQGVSGQAVNEYSKVDFSPLLALIDSETGSQLLKGYTNPQDRGLQLGKLAEGLDQILTQGTSGMTRNQLELFGKLFQDKTVATTGQQQSVGEKFTEGTARVGGGITDPVKQIMGGAGAKPPAIPRDEDGMSKAEKERLELQRKTDARAAEAAKRAEEEAAARRKKEDEAKAKAKRITEPGSIKTLTGLDNSEKALDSIEALTAKKGVEPSSWVGLGDQIDPFVSEDETLFRQELGKLEDAYALAISGQAMSEKQAERLKSRMPSVGEWTYKTFQAKLKGYRDQLQRERETILDALEAAGKDTSKWRGPAKNRKKSPETTEQESGGVTPEEAAAELERRRKAKGGQ